MKHKFTLVSAFLAATSFLMGEIVVNDVLSYEGFVDTSYTYLDADGENDNNFSVEEVEISWLFDFNPITARIDIEYEENANDLEVERAYIVYDFGEKCENSSLTVGRYASMLAFEAYEPTGLYQYTNAYGYSLSGFAVQAGGNIYADSELSVFLNSIFFPVGERYSQGIRYTYEDEKSFFGFALQDGTLNYENRLGGDSSADSTAVDDGGYGFEIAYAYECSSDFSIFVGGSYEIGDGVNYSTATSGTNFTTGNTETYIFNTYATYELGAWLFAVELNFSETFIDDIDNLGSADAEVDSLTGLIMANYAYNDSASVTGRISWMDTTFDAANASEVDGNALKYTIAHNYAFLDNLIFITEFSYLNGNFDVDGNSVIASDGHLEELFLAGQMIFTF